MAVVGAQNDGDRHGLRRRFGWPKILPDRRLALFTLCTRSLCSVLEYVSAGLQQTNRNTCRRGLLVGAREIRAISAPKVPRTVKARVSVSKRGPGVPTNSAERN